MGEENKEEKKEKEKKEENKEENKEEEKKEEKPPEIVLKVDMHCEACARKVARALKGFEGVENVTTDSKASKVVVKGKAADPIKVCERLQKKSGRKVELISPLPEPSEGKDQNKEETKKEAKEEKKEEPPTPVTVILNVRMHCEACAQVLQKRIRKIKGVESVLTDVANDQVIVKGIVDPTKLVDDVYKRTKKQASIVPEEKKEEKREEEKKEEKEGEKKGGEEDKGSEDDKKSDVKRSEYWPSKYYLEYQYAYPPPQMFSDENPNACSVM
ncbi:Heavy metal-associated domain containing protein [Parasponia andersonii]|uniref:Heavy metal-associated domain containing protein n=1 Tax=Parasponia andersonii TaxID=3476 RepID=A0A2P5ANK8_PARAD|nr:Heavy metal-associated domain containing protein [Parasponia andersonii]